MCIRFGQIGCLAKLISIDLYRPLPYVYTITDETALASVNPLDKAGAII
jgi:hypothetical protein